MKYKSDVYANYNWCPSYCHYPGIGLLKGLENLEIRGRVETIQTTTLLRSVRILRRVLETRGDLCYPDFRERPSVNSDVKNSRSKIIINEEFRIKRMLHIALTSLKHRKILTVRKYFKSCLLYYWNKSFMLIL